MSWMSDARWIISQMVASVSALVKTTEGASSDDPVALPVPVPELLPAVLPERGASAGPSTEENSKFEAK